MRILETPVFTFDELSDDAKDRARQWMRDCHNQDTDFSSEFVIEDAKTCLALLGFNVESVYYSGFSSQGDGACFVGTWSARDVKPVRAMREYAPRDATLRTLSRDLNALARRDKGAYATLTHRDRYCHEMSVSFSVEARRDATEETLKEAARDAMRWIYKNLETEYDYRMADEQIDEDIRANEYEFTADGRRA